MFCPRRPSIAVIIAIAVALFSSRSHAAPPSPFVAQVQGSGAPVILIPGLTCSGAVWKETAAHLVATHHQVHVLTLAGFGGAKPVEGAWLPTMRDGLVAYVSEHHLSKPVIIGHSLGAFLGYALAAEKPELVGGLVAVDGVPFLPALTDPQATETSMAPMAARVKAMMAGQSAKQFADSTRGALVMQVSDDAKREAVARDSVRSSPAVVAEAVSSLMTTDLRPKLSTVKCPVLQLAAGNGAPSDSVKQAYAAQLTQVPQASVEVVEGSKHFIMLDAPEAFQKRVDAFLAQVEQK